MPLTDTELRRLKPREKTYKKGDGGGLFVQVTPSGSKLWRLKYRFEGREKLQAFGAYPDVSLAQARERRRGVKALLAQGSIPWRKRNRARLKRRR